MTAQVIDFNKEKAQRKLLSPFVFTEWSEPCLYDFSYIDPNKCNWVKGEPIGKGIVIHFEPHKGDNHEPN